MTRWNLPWWSPGCNMDWLSGICFTSVRDITTCKEIKMNEIIDESTEIWWSIFLLWRSILTKTGKSFFYQSYCKNGKAYWKFSGSLSNEKLLNIISILCILTPVNFAYVVTTPVTLMMRILTPVNCQLYLTSRRCGRVINF